MSKRGQGFWSRRVERAQSNADRRNAAHLAAKNTGAISYEDAARLLGRSEVLGLVYREVLDPAVMESGYQGVTRESVERELEWQRTATGWQRFRRRGLRLLDYLSRF